MERESTRYSYVHFISLDFTSFHFISCHFISLHFISFHIMLFHFILFHFISTHFISYHFIEFHFTSFHCRSYHFISCFHFISVHIISFVLFHFHFISNRVIGFSRFPICVAFIKVSPRIRLISTAASVELQRVGAANREGVFLANLLVRCIENRTSY